MTTGDNQPDGDGIELPNYGVCGTCGAELRLFDCMRCGGNGWGMDLREPGMWGRCQGCDGAGYVVAHPAASGCIRAERG